MYTFFYLHMIVSCRFSDRFKQDRLLIANICKSVTGMNTLDNLELCERNELTEERSLIVIQINVGE
jgi:hypothetical protein